MRNKIVLLIISAIALVAILAGCDTTSSSQKQNRARRKDQTVSAEVLGTYQQTQPVPRSPWSQLRQNLIEIEKAQMDGAQTTSFFFNQGVQNPVDSCPSVGFPIPTTSQLTNPVAKVPGDSDAVIGQLETNGIYTGDSTGTYVVCVAPNGKAYANYWEGFVKTVSGPAVWRDGSVQLTGPSSHSFSTHK